MLWAPKLQRDVDRSGYLDPEEPAFLGLLTMISLYKSRKRWVLQGLGKACLAFLLRESLLEIVRFAWGRASSVCSTKQWLSMPRSLKDLKTGTPPPQKVECRGLSN